MQKTLIILRHAKAETAVAGQEDHARRLAERGVLEAQKIGDFMQKNGLFPQKILCSTAIRTRQTLDYISSPNRGEAGRGAHPENADVSQAGPHPDPPPMREGGIEYSDTLYNASESQLLKIVARQPDALDSLMLIGHNPGVHQLAIRLTGNSRLAAEFPTCALAVIGMDGWQDTRGELKRFITPKEI